MFMVWLTAVERSRPGFDAAGFWQIAKAAIMISLMDIAPRAGLRDDDPARARHRGLGAGRDRPRLRPLSACIDEIALQHDPPALRRRFSSSGQASGRASPWSAGDAPSASYAGVVANGIDRRRGSSAESSEPDGAPADSLRLSSTGRACRPLSWISVGRDAGDHRLGQRPDRRLDRRQAVPLAVGRIQSSLARARGAHPASQKRRSSCSGACDWSGASSQNSPPSSTWRRRPARRPAAPAGPAAAGTDPDQHRPVDPGGRSAPDMRSRRA